MMLPLILLLLAQVPNATLDTTARGTFSEVSDPKQLFVRSPAEWSVLWKSHAPAQAAPAIDFPTHAVAAVFLGTRPTGGFTVEIVRTRDEAGTLVVEYVERQPDPRALVTQAPLPGVDRHPYHPIDLKSPPLRDV
jgi:hypothetical protein